MNKAIIKRLLIISLILVFGFIIQTSFFSKLKLAGVGPNILLILTVSLGLLRGPLSGMLAGAFCGILCDLYDGTYLGLFFILFIYLGYLSGLLKRWFYGEDLKLPLVLIGFMDVLYGICVYLVGFMLRQQFDFKYYLNAIILPEAVYTMLVAIIVYFLVFRLNEWLEASAQRGGNDFV